jgi:hypothetical protein
LTVGPGAFAVASGDCNGDGIVDMVSVNQGDNTVSVLMGNLEGGFNPQVTYPTGAAPTAVVTGDFNNDGNLDLAVTDGNCAVEGGPNATTALSCSPGTVSILLGNGDGSFQPHLDYATGKGPSSLAAGDFNGDGKLDLAIANGQDGTVSALLGRAGMEHFSRRSSTPWPVRKACSLAISITTTSSIWWSVESPFQPCWATVTELFRLH